MKKSLLITSLAALLSITSVNAGNISWRISIGFGGHSHAYCPPVVYAPVVVSQPIVVQQPVVVSRPVVVQPAQVVYVQQPQVVYVQQPQVVYVQQPTVTIYPGCATPVYHYHHRSHWHR